MKRSTLSGAIGCLLLASGARAQEPSPTVEGEGGTDTPPAEAPAPAPADPAPPEPVEASPEVQRQVGLATEKETATASAAPAASAEAPAPSAPGDSKEEGEEDQFGHAMQFGLRAGLVAGFKVIFRYEDSPFCKEPNLDQPTSEEPDSCGFMAPLATEVALSFAPFDGLEPYVFGRFGFSGESQSNTKALKAFGVGTRVYTMSDSRFKIFVEPAVGLQVEKGAGNPDFDPAEFDPNYKNDFLIHVGIGPQYDIAKAVGIYLNVGFDFTMLRAFSATMLGNIGLQIRVP